jgi:outer membrane protein assembly factor BamB
MRIAHTGWAHLTGKLALAGLLPVFLGAARAVDSDSTFLVVQKRYALARSPWPKKGGDLGNTGKSKAPSTRGRLRWAFDPKNANGTLGECAVGSDGTVYYGDLGGNLYAVSAAGSLLWRYVDPGNQFVRSPALANDGTILYPSIRGLVAVSASGRHEWTARMPSSCGSATIGSDGTIYCGSDAGKLYAMNASGSLLWSKAIGGPEWAPPAIGFHGTIYFGSDDHCVYALSPAGRILWRYRTRWKVEAPVTIGGDETVYAPSGDGTLYALDRNGHLLWKFKCESSLLRAVAIGKGQTVYVSTGDLHLYCLDSHGRVKWSFATTGYTSPVTTSDGVVYSLGANELVAIDEKGNSLWNLELRDHFASDHPWADPSIGADGCVYVVTLYGLLMAIGSPRFSMSTL